MDINFFAAALNHSFYNTESTSFSAAFLWRSQVLSLKRILCFLISLYNLGDIYSVILWFIVFPSQRFGATQSFEKKEQVTGKTDPPITEDGRDHVEKVPQVFHTIHSNNILFLSLERSVSFSDADLFVFD